MKTLRFWGESDDIVLVDNGNGVDEFYDSSFEVKYGEEGVRVHVRYGLGDTGTWMIGVEPLDEDVPIPSWDISMKLGGRGYSAELSMVVPDGALVEPAGSE